MRIGIRVEPFRNALSKLLTVVDRKSSRPILSQCLIKSHDNFIEIFASDLEVSARLKIPADVENSGSFCISAKNIFDILRELPDDEVSLQVSETDNLLKLQCGSIKYSLLISSTEEFPVLNFEPQNGHFSVPVNAMLDLISKTSHAISSDETKVYLNGIFLQEVDSKLRAVATDAYRLALVEEIEFGEPNEALSNGIIIPKKGVGEMKKLADTYPNKSLKVSVDDSFLYLEAEGEYYLTIRLIAREYPKYQAVIPNKTTYSLKVDKEILLNAVKRVKLLANEKSNGIRLSLKDNNVVISANHPSLGDAVENIEVNYSGKEMDIGLNAKYLLDTFSVLDDSDISFEFNNELSPLIVRSSNMPNFLGVIMPLKL